jgi:hypothetical protein
VRVVVEVISVVCITVGEVVSVTVSVTSGGNSVDVTVSVEVLVLVFVLALRVFLGPWTVVETTLIVVEGTRFVQSTRVTY